MKRLVASLLTVAVSLLSVPAKADTIKESYIDPMSYSVSFTEYTSTDTGNSVSVTNVKTHTNDLFGLFPNGEAVCALTRFDSVVDGTYMTTGAEGALYIYCPVADDMYIYQFGE